MNSFIIDYRNKIKYVLSCLGPYQRSSFVLLAVLIASAFIETLGVGVLLPLAEVCLKGSNELGTYTKHFASLFSVFPKEYLIHFLWGAILVIMILRALSLFLKRYLILKFSADLKKFWSKKIMTKMIHYQFKEIIKLKKGVLVTNLRIAPNHAAKALREVLEMLAKLVLALFTLAFMIMLNWKVSLAAVIIGIILILIQWNASKRYSIDVGVKKIKVNQKIKSFVVESFQGIRQIKSFGMESQVINSYTKGVNFLEDLVLKFNVISFLPRIAGELVIAIILISFILGYIFIVKKSIISIIPLLGVMVICFQRLYFNLGEILSRRIQVLSGIPALKLVSDLAFSKEHTEEMKKGIKVEKIRKAVVFKDLCFEYEDKSELFTKINMNFQKNQITAVVGPSGCGKTTACDLISGFYRHSKGDILVDDDINFSDINISAWRKMIGYVSQDTFLFNCSIKENILCGQADISFEEVVKASKSAGAHDFIMNLNEQYDTVLGEEGSGISGGQKQRIAIARALVRHPEILIFDEATSALDSENEKIILETIQNLKEDKIIIFVSHRIPVLTIANNIYVLDKGKLVEEGDFHTLLENKSTFWKLYNSTHENEGVGIA